MTNTAKQPTKQWINFPKASGSGTTTWQMSSKCVTERIGAQAYTDAAPTGLTSYVGKGYFGTDTNASCTIGNYADAEVNSIYPDE
jgi:hypothetical protein